MSGMLDYVARDARRVVEQTGPWLSVARLRALGQRHIGNVKDSREDIA